MQLRDIMSTPAVTCDARESLNDAARRMWECDCGSLPVVDDGGRVIGMVTDRDICMAAYTQGLPLRDIAVERAMSPRVFSCREGDSLADAERLMSEQQIRRIPVVDGEGRARGIVSLNDVARHAAGARKRDGLDRELTQTLAAICQPRASATGARATM